MHSIMQHLCRSLNGSTLWNGLWVRDSRWIFPAIEAVHIVALALLFGAMLVLNLRLLGVTLTYKPAARLAREFAPWILWSLTSSWRRGSALRFRSDEGLRQRPIPGENAFPFPR